MNRTVSVISTKGIKLRKSGSEATSK